MPEWRYLTLFLQEMEAYAPAIRVLVAQATGDSPDAGAAHEKLCRIIHSIAGTSGSVDLADLADLTASLEDCLRRNGPGYPPELARLILDTGAYCLERLTAIVGDLSSQSSAGGSPLPQGEGGTVVNGGPLPLASPSEAPILALKGQGTGRVPSFSVPETEIGLPPAELRERYERLRVAVMGIMAGQESAPDAPPQERFPAYRGELSEADLAILRAFDESEPDAGSPAAPGGGRASDAPGGVLLPEEVEYFMLEAGETLEAMHEALAQLGPGMADAEAALAIQRLAHKLKGAAGAAGYAVAGGIAHRLEDLMASVRRRTLAFTPAVIEATRHGLTALETNLSDVLSAGHEDPALVERLSAEYMTLLPAATGASTPGPAPAAPSGQPAGESAWLPLLGASAERYLRVDARRLDQLMGRLAELSTNRAGLAQAGWDLQVSLRELRQALHRLQSLYSRFAGSDPSTFSPSFPGASIPPLARSAAGDHVPGDGQKWFIPSSSYPAHDAPMPPAPASGAGAPPTSQLVARVLATRDRTQRAQQPPQMSRPAMPASEDRSPLVAPPRSPGLPAGERWDPLELDQYGDFDHLVRALAEAIADVATVSMALQETITQEQRLLQSHEHLTSLVQRELMELRLVPIGQIVPRLQRAAHAYATELGKAITFVVQGESTQVDREVVEAIADPLIQLVRNAIAHGIEPVEDRLESGKPEAGLLWLHAYYLGNEVVLEFGDDGHGINPHRLVATAVAAGLLSPAESRRLTPQEMLELIFVSGISTSAEVTALAGRGIGMDVVRSAVEHLRGSISVQSDSGRGTVFRLRVPISLSILQVLQVRAAGVTYAVPLLSVERIHAAAPAHLAPAGPTPPAPFPQKEGGDGSGTSVPVGRQGRRLLRLVEDEEVVEMPAFWLNELLGMAPETLAQPAGTGAPGGGGSIPTLLLQANRRRVAVLVDSVTGEREIVVKRLPLYLRRPGVRGASIMGADEALLVLDIPELAAAALRGADTASASSSGVQPPRPQPGPAVLVVDDSPAIRRSVKQMLTRAGYEVVLARDGMEALEQMVQQLPRVMLLDIEMPRLDGFELLSIMRNHEQFAAIPVVILTSRGAEKHRRYTQALGANGYLVKPCPQDELLAAIAQLTGQGAPS
jgi:chemotaxis protein histidine kinase CheA/CheY-like chemotaxis protein